MRRRLVCVFAVVLLLGAAATAGADSVTFITKAGTLYLYEASQDNGGWSVGDTISLTGMDKVFQIETPGHFTGTSNALSATWTCTEAMTGDPWFGVYSNESAGTISWGIAAESTSAGSVTGPGYVPEPLTAVIFSAGLVALGAMLVRRRAERRAR